MFTDVQIINLGLAKLGASRVSRIDPPSSALEKEAAIGYTQWKLSELAKRRWTFATLVLETLAMVSDSETGQYKYKYQLPKTCLFPIRQSHSEWKKTGRYLLSNDAALQIDLVTTASEEDFDPLFVDVLAARIAVELAEYVTQSNTKKETAAKEYKASVKDAGRMNAFTIGAEDYAAGDEDFEFITARF